MSLTQNFNDDYSARKLASAVLQVKIATDGGNTYMIYDFNARIMSTRTGSRDGGIVVTPFSKLDPDSLEFMYERLKKLGGEPPAPPRDIRKLPPPAP